MFKALNSRFIRIYIVPGAVFQSVMIGGGYGTGREIVEYFTSFGALGGLLALGVAVVVLAVVLALTFELARLFGAYDYRSFFQQLLGNGWIAFEILIILQFLLVLAVLASAAGNILRDHFSLPYGLGLVFMLTVVAVLTFYGRELIVRVLTFWSLFLYTVLIAFVIQVFSGDWTVISAALQDAEILHGWSWSGFKYALYNLAAAPLLLYTAKSFTSRRESLHSGVIAAVIAALPALMFHLAFFAAYPAVLEQTVPVYWMMNALGMTTLVTVYSVMLFGTFIETGAGMLQGINDRIEVYLTEKRGTGTTRTVHATLAICAIAISALLSLAGITTLIAKGYGTMAWGFFIIYIIPLTTIGLARIARAGTLRIRL